FLRGTRDSNLLCALPNIRAIAECSTHTLSLLELKEFGSPGDVSNLSRTTLSNTVAAQKCPEKPNLLGRGHEPCTSRKNGWNGRKAQGGGFHNRTPDRVLRRSGVI